MGETHGKLMRSIAIFFFSLFVCSSSSAGLVGGPLIVWYNLSKNPQPIDGRIQKYLESGEAEKQCWTWGATLYMNAKPPTITRDLVELALVKGDVNAIEKINKILKAPFDDADDGFDGIIAYSDANGPTYYRLTTGKKKIKTYKMTNLRSLEDGICVVIPPIIRKP